MSLFTVDLDRNLTHETVHQFLRLNDPEELRPQEGPRLDFNEKLPHDLGDVVTAFSNTFGGLVLVGVREKKGKQLAIPDDVVGLEETNAAIKTKLVNIILSTVQPRPVFSVGVVPLTHMPSRCVAVVRVEEGLDTPYMYVQGQQNKVSVRIGDSNRGASLEQLKALFEKGLRSIEQAGQAYASIGDLYVLEKGSRCFRYNRIVWSPLSPFRIRLDQQTERTFQKLIQTRFARDRSSSFEMTRTAKYTDVDSPNKEWNYHRKWRISDLGAIGFISKLGRLKHLGVQAIQAQETELLGDWVIDAISLLRLARDRAAHFAYMGSGRLVHQMHFLDMSKVRFEVSMPTVDVDVYDRMTSVSIDTAVWQRVSESSTENIVNLSGVDDHDIVEVLADSFMHHIRDVGGRVDWKRFCDEIKYLADAFSHA